jgi:5-formyltetrahydrofolate cyclo-ligase
MEPIADAAALKAAMRAAALLRRERLTPDFRTAASLAIAKHVAAAISGGITVALYHPIRGEADPRPLVELTSRGIRFCLPAPMPDGLVFRPWRDGEALVPAGFGTVAPPPIRGTVEPDLILLPLAAFDRAGHRIGYGKGHYDRGIARLHAAGRRPRLVGLAFAVQEVDRVPAEPHDIALDAVATETAFIPFAIGVPG